VGLQSALKVEDFIAPSTIVEKQVFCRDLSPLLIIASLLFIEIGFWLERETIDFGSKLLTTGIS